MGILLLSLTFFREREIRIQKEDFGKMVSYRGGRITAVPLREAIGKLNLVDVQTQYDTDRYNGRRTILG
jgi:hypothetical protein